MSKWLLFNAKFRTFSALSWREQVNFQWDEDEVRFVLDQHAELDFHSARSLKQQSAGRHVAPLGHMILIPSQPAYLTEKQQIPILKSLVLSNRVSNPRYNALEVNTLTITPPIRLLRKEKSWITIGLFCVPLQSTKDESLYLPLFYWIPVFLLTVLYFWVYDMLRIFPNY